MDLSTYERLLRRDDRALRLRMSMESARILIERKTFRGRIGALLPGGLPHPPDGGRRREEGHVLVASVRPDQFFFNELRDSLREADTWRRWDRNADPSWRRLEDEEQRRERERRFRRQMDARYHASQLFDRYTWKHKQRISVPERIR